MKITRHLGIVFLALSLLAAGAAKAQQGASVREHVKIDTGWRFALGHAYNPALDFYNGTGAFSYFAKTGYGDGAASPDFDDRSWRKISLPHDWAAELPFDPRGSTSHGYKAIGRNFPENSVGWYRKTFTIPATDLGKHISIAFDGVMRNSIVWINGHYLGTEISGYNSFEYNIGEYLNYGGENVIAVRADATMEEGWFYEGAGIYRHVWLNKTNQLHVASNGTFVTTIVNSPSAKVNVQTTIDNNDIKSQNFIVVQSVFDEQGNKLAADTSQNIVLRELGSQEVKNALIVQHPNLWSVETPYLYHLTTSIIEGHKIVDQYNTTFGIRTIRFDANQGFFLNGKHVEIKGTNNHQDHAGVGVALPDGLQDYRIRILKSMGCNAYRCSHNPPTPELLDACDKLGMLVIDENRRMGVSTTQLNDLKAMIMRDRNHPSIISWSIGNEEWGIEGNVTGTRIAATMQAYAKSIDSTRYITAAVSGGIGGGISNSIELLGYNYIATKNTDEQHKKHPAQFSWGTEEGSTLATRGVYEDDSAKHYLFAYDRKQSDFFQTLEYGWKYYLSRPYLAGMFIWSGFDYRGEPVPFGWPSIESLFGMVDACGFPKDDYYYLKAWWTNEPVLHLLPNWNLAGKEGKVVDVWAYSNCDEVELFLNGKSQGRKKMEPNGHLSWKVVYEPGKLEAVGYKNGKKIINEIVKTTGAPANLQIAASNTTLKANGEDIAVLNISTTDNSGLLVPTADDLINFKIKGPGKIIGVGNGNPTSLEPDQYHEYIHTVAIENLKEKIAANKNVKADITADYDDSGWQKAFTDVRDDAFAARAPYVLYRGDFTLPDSISNATVSLFYKSLGKVQSVYVNGRLLGADLELTKKGNAFQLDLSLVHPGKNSIVIVAKPLIKANIWANVNTDPGLLQLVYPANGYKRKLFNGYAQVIVQTTNEPGDIVLSAESAGLKGTAVKIRTEK
ncbi:MAG: beta-galactosidase GalA [Mucilaginibacter sp.]